MLFEQNEDKFNFMELFSLNKNFGVQKYMPNIPFWHYYVSCVRNGLVQRRRARLVYQWSRVKSDSYDLFPFISLTPRTRLMLQPLQYPVHLITYSRRLKSCHR